MSYAEFLRKKTDFNFARGFDIQNNLINKTLFDFQRAIVKWAVKKGKAAIFSDCGTGKSFMQIEWAHLIGGNCLIIAPLSVTDQTILEAEKLGYKVTYIENESQYVAGINITNYERLDGFTDKYFDSIVLDESSILKSIDGKTKRKIIETFKDVKYKLSCTATPSPNDIVEICSQVEFLNIMSEKEIKSKYFINDADAGEYRLKGHAKNAFYKFMSSWAMFLRKPSDIGFSDDGYILPELSIDPIWLNTEYIPYGELFPSTEVKGIQGRINIRRNTIADKVKILADHVNATDEQWLIFCGLNDEASQAQKFIDNSFNLQGSDKLETKIRVLREFKAGKIKTLITKPKVGAFGLNLQNCHNIAFIGLSDSYEYYYQCIRRCYRYGQKEKVNVKIFLTISEQIIYHNVLKKELHTAELYDSVIREIQKYELEELGKIKGESMDKMEIKEESGESYRAIMGDNIETIKKLNDESIDLTVFSPPFFSLYTYSPSPRDIGNNPDDETFWKHMEFLTPELFRVLKSGRVMAVHCMNVPTRKAVDGYIGLKDFRGDLIRHYEKHGFIYDNEAIIPKNPQAQSIRTRAIGLTFSQFEKDSAMSRPALPDYVIKFRKPGENKIPIQNGDNGEISRDKWIELASGYWPSVRETRTLNTIKHENDEKHVCPLQLDTIENCIKLWSNHGEIVFDPFGGIGSVGYQAILNNRKAVMLELKPEYFNQMVENLNRAEVEKGSGLLGFDKE
jgi:DNA modification methylase